MDGVNASLHFTRINTQLDKEENTKWTKAELTYGVLVVTIGPNSKYLNYDHSHDILCLSFDTMFQLNKPSFL